jgi:hypothetical protein
VAGKAASPAPASSRLPQLRQPPSWQHPRVESCEDPESDMNQHHKSPIRHTLADASHLSHECETASVEFQQKSESGKMLMIAMCARGRHRKHQKHHASLTAGRSSLDGGATDNIARSGPSSSSLTPPSQSPEKAFVALACHVPNIWLMSDNAFGSGFFVFSSTSRSIAADGLPSGLASADPTKRQGG